MAYFFKCVSYKQEQQIMPMYKLGNFYIMFYNDHWFDLIFVSIVTLSYKWGNDCFPKVGYNVNIQSFINL